MSETTIVKIQFGNKTCPVKITINGTKMIFSFPYFKPMVEEIKNMEKREWDPESKVWVVEITRRNLFALDLLMYGEKSARYFESIRDCSDLVGTLSFWKHQVEMFNFIMTRHRCIIAGEMRTGKTLPALMVLELLPISSGWFISTKSAIMGVRAEMKKWGITKKWEMMTYDGFKSNIDQLKAGQNWPYPKLVVFDECQKLKNPGTQQTDQALWLSEKMEELFCGEEYVIGLSGTPAPKDPTDWWSICEVIRAGFLLEGTKNLLGRRLGNWEECISEAGKYWKLKKTVDYPTGWKPEEVDNLYVRLKGLVNVHLKKNCLDLPPIRYEVVDLTPSSELLRVGSSIADQATNVLDAINKLRQLSDGFQYQKEYDAERNRMVRSDTIFVGSPKIERLKQDLDEYVDAGRVIIYSGFQGSVDIIVQTCLEAGWVVLKADGRGWEIKYPRDYIPCREYSVTDVLLEMDRSTDMATLWPLAFVAQADSAGTGLELSSSPVIIYYSNTNNGAARMQSEARAHSNNMDKTRGLTVIDYCHLPIDYKIRESLMNKKDVQAISMGQLQEVMKCVS